MRRPGNQQHRGTRRTRGDLNAVLRLLLDVGAVLLVGSCGHASTPAPTPEQAATPLPPMLITNVQFDIIVEDFDAAHEQLGFVREMDGYIAEERPEDDNGRERLTVGLRVPSEHIGTVLDTLTTQFGEVIRADVWSADISERYAKLQRELATLEGSLAGLSGTELAEARERIEHIRGMIAFRLERVAFDTIVVHFFESP